MAHLFLCLLGNRCSGRGRYFLDQPVGGAATISGIGWKSFWSEALRNLFGTEVVKALRTFVCTICPGRIFYNLMNRRILEKLNIQEKYKIN